MPRPSKQYSSYPTQRGFQQNASQRNPAPHQSTLQAQHQYPAAQQHSPSTIQNPYPSTTQQQKLANHTAYPASQQQFRPTQPTTPPVQQFPITHQKPAANPHLQPPLSHQQQYTTKPTTQSKYFSQQYPEKPHTTAQHQQTTSQEIAVMPKQPSTQGPSAQPQPAVIVREPRSSTALTKMLSEWFKIRVSSDIVPDFIFPTFSIVFIVVYLDKPSLEEGVTQRIETMCKSFQASYVIGILRNGNEKTIAELQLRLGVIPLFIPVYDEQAAYEVILDILENDIKPKNLNDENLEFTDDFLQERVLEALCTIPGLKRHDCMILQQGCLADIAKATAEEIHESTPLSMEQARIIENFFRQDEPL